MANEKAKELAAAGKRHLNAGFTAMLPLIIVGAVGMALSKFFDAESPIGAMMTFLNEVGLNHYDIFVAMAIGQSISSRIGLVNGFVLGYLSNQCGLGIFGGIVVGFLSGGAGTLFNKVKMEGSTKALVALVVVPLVSGIVGYFLIKYFLAAPISMLQNGLVGFLKNISTVSAVLLAIVLGLMFGFDLGGPINKTAGLFVIVSLAEGARGPSGYVALAFMLPSMAAGLATLLDRKKALFDEDEHTQGPSIFALGCLSLSEPALPMMFSDLKFMVPANMVCTALLCAGVAALGIECDLPLGVLAFFFMNNPAGGAIVYAICLALLTGLILWRRSRLAKRGELDI